MRTVVISINQFYQVQFLMDGQLQMQRGYQSMGVTMAYAITKWLEEGEL